MINLVEEMMKIAGVKPTTIAELGSTYHPKHFKIRDKLYPKFTPEKQLEIIKLMGQRYKLTYAFDFEGDWVFSILDEDIVVHSEDFVKALANLVIKLYSDLTPNLKQQIKEILEG